MKKRKSLFMTAALAAVAMTAFTSCSQNADEEFGKQVSAQKAQFVGSIVDVTTRAGGTSWANGDQIGITSSDGQLDNSQFLTKGDGDFSGDAEFWFKNNDDVNFTAYYPYTAAVGSDGIINGKMEGLGCIIGTGAEAQDYLFGTGTGNASTTNITLAFKHTMAKVLINLNWNGVKSNSTWTINFPGNFQGKFNAKTGVAEGTASTFNVGGISNGYEGWALLEYPGAISGEFTLTAEDGTVIKGSIPAETTLVGGKEYTFNISLNQDKAAVTNCTIADWDVVTGVGINATTH